MADIQDNQILLEARAKFQIKQLEFNKEENQLRILELEDQIAKYRENIKQTDKALHELRESKKGQVSG